MFKLPYILIMKGLFWGVMDNKLVWETVGSEFYSYLMLYILTLCQTMRSLLNDYILNFFLKNK